MVAGADGDVLVQIEGDLEPTGGVAVEEHRQALVLVLPEGVVVDERRGRSDERLGVSLAHSRRHQLVRGFAGEVLESDGVLADLAAADVGGQEDRNSQRRGGRHQGREIGSGEH
ncbi:MAG: hypothetical protein H0V69_04185, partial [Acidimicrobiia bacterium]|nr:hypothetical protein [Acidimicrobiia bacterium]